MSTRYCLYLKNESQHNFISIILVYDYWITTYASKTFPKTTSVSVYS